MHKALLLFSAVVLAPAAFGQADIANLREDVRGLMQKVGELSARVEQLERENTALKNKVTATEETLVTLRQLNDAVSDINKTIQSSVAASENKVLQQVAKQMEILARQTNTAIEAVAKNAGPQPAVQTSFSDNFTKIGIEYTVQQGDTLGQIVAKTGAREQDIVNANKLTDRNRLQVGQKLFIPGGKL